jgi:hypothetical protein
VGKQDGKKRALGGDSENLNSVSGDKINDIGAELVYLAVRQNFQPLH